MLFVNDSFVEAARKGDMAAVQKALKERVSPNARNKAGYSALQMATANGQIDVMKYLIQKGADVNLRNKAGFTAMHSSKNKESIEVLIKAFGNINENDNLVKSTPLIEAASDGKSDVADALILAGADVNKETVQGDTALILAAANTNKKTVKLLLDKGAEIEKKNKNGDNALQMAAVFSRKAIMEELLDAGAYVNTQNKNGITPLMYAVLYGKADIVKLLLNRGADANLKNHAGKKAFDFLNPHNPDCQTMMQDSNLMRQLSGQTVFKVISGRQKTVAIHPQNERL